MEIKIELDIKDFILLCENTDREKICNLNIDRKEVELSKIEGVLLSQITTLTNYRKSLIHECVTGKRRITEADLAKVGANV